MYRLTVPVIGLVRSVNAEVDVATAVGASIQAPLLSLLLLLDLAKVIVVPNLIDLGSIDKAFRKVGGRRCVFQPREGYDSNIVIRTAVGWKAQDRVLSATEENVLAVVVCRLFCAHSAQRLYAEVIGMGVRTVKNIKMRALTLVQGLHIMVASHHDDPSCKNEDNGQRNNPLTV